MKKNNNEAIRSVENKNCYINNFFVVNKNFIDNLYFSANSYGKKPDDFFRDSKNFKNFYPCSYEEFLGKIENNKKLNINIIVKEYENIEKFFLKNQGEIFKEDEPDKKYIEFVESDKVISTENKKNLLSLIKLLVLKIKNLFREKI